MKKSKNKYSPWPAVALCLVFLALRIVDLALFTDPETSFPTVGPSAARWGTALVGAAALLVMGRRADEKIAPGRKSLMGVMMAVTGTVLVLAGLSQLLSAAVVWPSMVLLTAAGVWFFAMGWRVLSAPEGRGTAMPPNAVPDSLHAADTEQEHFHFPLFHYIQMGHRTSDQASHKFQFCLTPTLFHLHAALDLHESDIWPVLQ